MQLLTFADFGKARYHVDTDSGIFRHGCSRPWTKIIQLMLKIGFWLRERNFRTRVYQTGDVRKSRPGVHQLRARLLSEPPDVLIFPDQASPAAWLEKAPGQRWIQISHHNALRFVNQAEIGEHSLLDALTARKYECLQVKLCDVCVTPSTYMRDVVKSFITSERPIHVISNIVNELPVTAVRSSTRNRIFIPSGGSRFKGSDVLPELIAAIHSDKRAEGREIEFFISGDLSSLQRNRIRERSPKVRLFVPGHLTHEKTLIELAQSNVCVSPTWIENQSMALLEAKALGVPFVAFDVGGNREILGFQDRVSERGKIRELADSTLEILCRNQATESWDYKGQNRVALEAWTELITQVTQESFETSGKVLNS